MKIIQEKLRTFTGREVEEETTSHEGDGEIWNVLDSSEVEGKCKPETGFKKGKH